MYDEFTDSLEGDMSIPTAKKNTSQPGAPDFNTLDEPIRDTIVKLLNIFIYKNTISNELIQILVTRYSSRWNKILPRIIS